MCYLGWNEFWGSKHFNQAHFCTHWIIMKFCFLMNNFTYHTSTRCWTITFPMKLGWCVTYKTLFEMKCYQGKGNIFKFWLWNNTTHKNIEMRTITFHVSIFQPQHRTLLHWLLSFCIILKQISYFITVFKNTAFFIHCFFPIT